MLYDVVTGKLLKNIAGDLRTFGSSFSKNYQPGSIATAFAPDGLALAVVTWNGAVKLWDLSPRKTGIIPQISYLSTWAMSIIEPKEKSSAKSIFDFRSDIPGWLIERGLQTHPRQITQALFGFEVTDNLALQEFHYAREAAVSSLIMRFTSIPAILPASYVDYC